eukprot:9828212-Ditylum_brightwellii.AAC.1
MARKAIITFLTMHILATAAQKRKHKNLNITEKYDNRNLTKFNRVDMDKHMDSYVCIMQLM